MKHCVLSFMYVCVCFGVLEANVINVLWGRDRSLCFVVVLLF